MGLQFPDLWSEILTGPSLGSLLPEASPSFQSKCTQPKALPSASQAESSKICSGFGAPGRVFHYSRGDVLFDLLVIGHSCCRLKECISLDANLTFWMWLYCFGGRCGTIFIAPRKLPFFQICLSLIILILYGSQGKAIYLHSVFILAHTSRTGSE